MKTSEFDFHLPGHLIALRPADNRDESRLMVLHKNGKAEHRLFRHAAEYMTEGDMLLLNDTKVMPVRLAGFKPTGGRVEFILVKNISGAEWEILCSKRYTGKLKISETLEAEVKDGHTAVLACSGDISERLAAEGMMPLPPYIKRNPDALDRVRYQTVYATRTGSIAAPTAGLHFTGEMLEEIRKKGVLIRYLTLHIGKGTFMPVRSEQIEGHAMEAEYFEINRGLIDEIKSLKGRLFAVGTTTTRALEGFMSGLYVNCGNGSDPLKGTTNIFIHPGYGFKAVDCLLTNFHLPGSTPLMLASAFAGRERLLEAYGNAVNEKYRFFSYGDAMLLL